VGGALARDVITRAQTDRAPVVRTAATRALAEMDARARAMTPTLAARPNASAPRGGVAVTVRTMGDQTGRASLHARERMRAEVARNLSGEPKVAVTIGDAGQPSYVVDGAIRKLDFRAKPMELEAVCEVSLVVSRPPRGILLVSSGEAIVQRPKGAGGVLQKAQMEEEAIAHAVKSAHENLARFLASQ
jgi:hypothetical protein